MSISTQHIAPETTTKQIISPGPLKDFSVLLQDIGLGYTRSEFYWQVGAITKVQGWIIHLSVIRIQLPDLLKLVIPELISRSVSFKIVLNDDAAVNLLEGTVGYINLGKLISIYPETDMEAVALAKKLIEMTDSYRGPGIPTDAWLGSIVYTRYGSFNPVLKNTSQGIATKFIYDTQGKLIPDPYTIPFSMPPGIQWPFESICPIPRKKEKALLNHRYYPVNTLKKDVKGNVIKALYFKNLLSIRSCIIKQGRKNIGSDDVGRDFKERLKWQFELYRNLIDTIPMAPVVEYFEENGDSYLVMDYIDGIPLQQWISGIYAGGAWLDLDVKKKNAILDRLIEVLSIIQRLHQRGYIHRDITTENFLIDKKDKLFLIDMELAWSMESSQPDPPFGQGTPGFMSPEQMRLERPTVKEDIYTLGCFMLTFLTNLSPNKWNPEQPEALRNSLPVLTGETKISNIICNCLKLSPEDRPELTTILDTVLGFQAGLKDSQITYKSAQQQSVLSVPEVACIIQYGLNGLANRSRLSQKGRWLSQLHAQESEIGNPQAELRVLHGWHTGVAGPMWVVAKARAAGFDVSSCREVYDKSWEYLQQNQADFLAEANSGLFHGGPGVALAIAEGLDSKLLAGDQPTHELLWNCFAQPAQGLDLTDGVAGQGMALLRCLSLIDKTKAGQALGRCINALISTQKTDGSWKYYATMDLYKGHIGIVLFLIAFLEQFSDQEASKTLDRAFEWLLKTAFDSRGLYKTTNPVEFNSRFTGIMLCLTHGYQLLKRGQYKQIAEVNLRSIPLRPVSFDFTLQTGLAGVGCLLLDAFVIFKKQEWKERADWIVELFMLTFQKKLQNAGSWAMTQNTISTADLFNGTTGILYFLLQWQTRSIAGIR